MRVFAAAAALGGVCCGAEPKMPWDRGDLYKLTSTNRPPPPAPHVRTVRDILNELNVYDNSGELVICASSEDREAAVYDIRQQKTIAVLKSEE